MSSEITIKYYAFILADSSSLEQSMVELSSSSSVASVYWTGTTNIYLGTAITGGQILTACVPLRCVTSKACQKYNYGYEDAKYGSNTFCDTKFFQRSSHGSKSILLNKLQHA